MIGKTFGQYQIIEYIGDGGMGTVYRGVNRNLDQTVAVKVLHPHLARNESLIARFRHEALIQAKFSHPNIVRVTDFVREGDICAIVMEFVQGKTFDRILTESSGPLSVAKTVEMFLPLLQALEFAHGEGIIHRDIKPNNLILREMKGVRIPMIMDFGIARVLGDTKRMTAEGVMMGTLQYMSPEQARSEREVDRRTDIYSMAVSMYEMLSGRVPFDRDSEYGLMEAIIKEPPPPIRTFNPQVPEGLEKVLLVAMAKDPNSRYASAAQFASALTSLSHPGPRPTPPPPPPPPPTPSRGQTVPEIQPQPVSPPAPRATPPAPLPMPTTSALTKGLLIGGAALALVVTLVLIFAFQGKSKEPAVNPTPKPVKTVPGNVYKSTTEAGVNLNDLKPEIERFVRGWISDWEQLAGANNLWQYANNYTEDFYGYNAGRRLNKSQWMEDKRKKYVKKAWVRIQAEDFRIDVIDKETANVTFYQRFRSSNYYDKQPELGDKILRLKKIGGQWKIQYENWQKRG